VQTIEAIVVIGSGNWGLTLATLFARNLPTRVWALDAKLADHLKRHRAAPGEFFRCTIPDSVVIERKYASQVDETRTLLVIAVPSSQVRSVARELAERVRRPLILCVSKGFDAEQRCTMSRVIEQEIPGAAVVVLSGPTIANEVAEGKPTRAVLACDDLMMLALVKMALRNDVISFEAGRNPSHHEICAALKGLVAIAVGMADGLDLGANMQGVLMTEGIRELAVVASFFDIPGNVAYGVSGCGDLITTCISPNSRNRRLGALLARGLSLEEALAEVRMTVEGVAMSQTIETLWSLDVSIPLIHLVNAILQGRRQDIRGELSALITRL